MNKNIFVFFKQFYLKVITNIFPMITDPVLLVFNINQNSTLYMVNTNLRDMHSGLKKYNRIILHVQYIEQTNSTT